MSTVKLSTCVAIAGLIATALGSMVALTPVAALGAPAPTPIAPIAPTIASPVIRPGPIISPQIQPALHGFVDLHAHPLSYRGFGGKLVFGPPDVNMPLPPASPPPFGSCNQKPFALNEADALANENQVHGGAGTDNACGDFIRELVIHVLQVQTYAYNPPDSTYTSAGYPSFPTWPTWDDITRQRMWVDWIRRAFVGGQRVMVALAVNNMSLGKMVSGPGDLPTDDMWVGDQQIALTKQMVAQHQDFMAIALSSQDVYNIVSSNRLAIVLGVELDNIGNLMGGAASPQQVVAEVDRLYNEGVRYIFPVHLVDNPLGGTAAYIDMFNVANAYQEGHPWNLGCVANNDIINYVYSINPPTNFFAVTGINAAMQTKLGRSFQIPGQTLCPKIVNGQPVLDAKGNQVFLGNINLQGLTPAGAAGIKEMMRKAMLIDIDHMSQQTVSDTFALVGNPQTVAGGGGYPLNSGHNGVRGFQAPFEPPPVISERSLTAAQYGQIGAWHGMAGVGSAGLNALQWLAHYQTVVQSMGGNVAAGFGTDLDGLERGMPPHAQAVWDPQSVATNPQYTACYNPCIARAPTCSGGAKPAEVQACMAARASIASQCSAQCQKQYPTQFNTTQVCVSPSYQTGLCVPSVQYSASFAPPTDAGGRTWNYNTDGVAHYGMLPDFIQDVSFLPGGANIVNNNLMLGADYFYHTWQRAEQQSRNVTPN